MCDVPADIRRAIDTDIFVKFFTTNKAYGAQIFKALDIKTNKMVGFSKWNYLHHLNKQQLAQWKSASTRQGPYPEGTNQPLQEHISKELLTKPTKWLIPESSFFLHLLFVTPSYQRCGIGAMLIAPGIAAADAACASIYLEASRAGLELYLRQGWRPVDEIHVNLDIYGYEGEGWVTEKCLIREPSAGPVTGGSNKD